MKVDTTLAALGAAAALLAGACEGVSTFDPDAVTDSPDVAGDTSVDTTVDPTMDTSVDTSIDTAVDTSVDPTVDTTVDTSVDTTVDTSVDTTVDTSPDGPPDAPCTPSGMLGCGSTVSGTNDGPGSTDLADETSCVSFTEDGPEIAWSLTTAGPTRLLLDLNELTADLDLFLYDQSAGSCDMDSCLGYSAEPLEDPEHIEHATMGGTLYVMVDGFDGAVGSFTLEVTCAEPEICDNGVDDDGDGDTDCDDFECMATTWCPEGCTPTAPVSCGERVTGNTSISVTPGSIDRWSCNDLLVDGPEHVYSFSAPATGEVVAELSEHDPAMDVFILSGTPSGCVSTSCIAHDVFSASFHAEADRTYYVVVDATDGYAGPYALTVSCS